MPSWHVVISACAPVPVKEKYATGEVVPSRHAMPSAGSGMPVVLTNTGTPSHGSSCASRHATVGEGVG